MAHRMWDGTEWVELPGSTLADVATSGDYDDLDNRPTLGTAAAEDVEAFDPAGTGASEAADAVADLPELTAGPGFDIDTSTPGFVRGLRPATPLPAKAAAVSGTTEATILNAAVPVSGFTLDTVLQFSASGVFVQNSGADRTPTIRLKFGSVAVFTFAPLIPTNAASRPWALSGRFAFQDFLGHRPAGEARFTIGGVSGAVDLGGWTVQARTNDTIDLSVTNNLDLTVQWSGATATMLMSGPATFLRAEHA